MIRMHPNAASLKVGICDEPMWTSDRVGQERCGLTQRDFARPRLRGVSTYSG